MKKREEVLDIKRIRLRDGDVLVIREVDEDPGSRQKIVKNLESTLRAKHVTICFVKSLSDVRALEEAQMNKFGWYRLKDD